MFDLGSMKLLIGIVFIAVVSGTPIQRRLSSRQIELTTAAAPILPKTPYPAAGFRPRVPFELPNEARQPKAVPEPTTSTSTTASPVEDFGSTEEPVVPVPVVPSSSVEEQDELDSNLNVPFDTYGAPRPQDSAELVDNTVEVVAAPAAQFEPPTKDAIEDFGATTISSIEQDESSSPSGNNERNVDLPSSTESNLASSQEASVEDVVESTSPEDVYGPPVFAADGRQVPAFTYGVPDDAGENELLPINGQFRMLNRLSELQSGRLIFVPADGSQLRQIYFASIPSGQMLRAKSRATSERLIRRM